MPSSSSCDQWTVVNRKKWNVDVYIYDRSGLPHIEFIAFCVNMDADDIVWLAEEELRKCLFWDSRSGLSEIHGTFWRHRTYSDQITITAKYHYSDDHRRELIQVGIP